MHSENNGIDFEAYSRHIGRLSPGTSFLIAISTFVRGRQLSFIGCLLVLLALRYKDKPVQACLPRHQEGPAIYERVVLFRGREMYGTTIGEVVASHR